jgi:hypothetical protein
MLLTSPGDERGEVKKAARRIALGGRQFLGHARA